MPPNNQEFKELRERVDALEKFAVEAKRIIGRIVDLLDKATKPLIVQ